MRAAAGRLESRSLNRRALLAVVALALVGLALRIWFLLAVTKDSSLVGDGLEFQGLANAIADGRGFVSPFTLPGHASVPTAHKPPLYPLVLALVSVFGGTGYVAHQVASAVVGTGTVLVCAAIARRLAGWRAAVLAAAIGAVYPVFLVADASLRSETLFALCVALALLAALRALEQPSAWRLSQLGIVIGLAALTRSEGVALLVLLALPVVFLASRSGRMWRLAVVTGVCALTLAPWLIRCWIVFDEPVAITTSYGDLIAGANCHSTYWGSSLGGWVFECAIGERGENEAVVARRLRSRGLRYARDHAGRLPLVVGARLLRPWGFYDPAGEVRQKTLGEGRSRTANWLGLATCWILMLLAAGALVVLGRRGQPVVVLLAPVLLVLLVSATSYGILRFRAAADVSLVVLGAIALDALVGVLQARFGRRLPASLADHGG